MGAWRPGQDVMSSEDLKRQAAARALEAVTDGMRLGLGTGSTAKHFVELLGDRVRAGLKVICVATSEATQAQAEGEGIEMSTLDATPELDLVVDGADELDPQLRLVKGGGGALLREKIVASASARMIVIADDSKQVATLGKFPLPVEVNPFGLEVTRRQIAAAAARTGCSGELVLRQRDGRTFVTDGGHYIIDCHFGVLPDPDALAAALVAIPGVVEHGLFIGLATGVVLASASGLIELGEI